MTHFVDCSFMNTIKEYSLIIITTINTDAKLNIIKFVHQYQNKILPSLCTYSIIFPISSPFHIIAIPIT